jgi:MFS family permease
MRWPGALNRQEMSALALTAPAFLLSRFEFVLGSLALPDIQASLSVPEDALSLIVAVARLGAVPAILLAIFADRFDRRRLLIVTIIGFALASLATAFAQNAVQFALAQAASRLFTAADEILCVVILVEAARPEMRGWLAGLMAMAGGLGDGAASLAYGFSQQIPGDWRGLFVVGALAALPLLLVRLGGVTSPRANRLLAKKSIGAVLRRYPARVVAVCAVFAIALFPYSATLSLMSKHLQSVFGYDRAGVAQLFIGAGAFAILGNVAAGALADRIGRRTVFAVSLVISAASFVVFYLGTAQTAPIFWTIALFTAFMSHVSLSVFAAELFPTSARATARALADLAGVLGIALGLVAESFLLPIAGSHAVAIAWLWPVALLSVPLVFLALPETARRDLQDIAPDEPSLKLD